MTKYSNKELLDPKHGKARRKEYRNKIQHGRYMQPTDSVDNFLARMYNSVVEGRDIKRTIYHGQKKYTDEGAGKKVTRAIGLGHGRFMKGNATGVKKALEYEPYNKTGEFSAKVDEMALPRGYEKKKKTHVAAVTILALFGMYLLSLQVGNGTTGYATCISDGNVMVGGITIIVLVLLLILINTRKMRKETIKYIPVRSNRKIKRKR